MDLTLSEVVVLSQLLGGSSGVGQQNVGEAAQVTGK